jgi:hypothetical protein
MVLISGDLYLAMFTKGERDAETKDNLNVSVNIDGRDVVSKNTLQWAILRDDMIHRGNASIAPVPHTLEEPISFESNLLTNSSVRVGITGDDWWAPEHILLLGRNPNGYYVPLAGEWNINTSLSTDFSDAHGPYARLTMPLRLVRLGGHNISFRGVLFLVKTSHVDNADSTNPIRLVITNGDGITVLNQEIGDTPQDDRFEKSDNWYTLNAQRTFNTEELNGGRITLSIRGQDAWLPKQVFLYALNTTEGRPSWMSTLLSVSNWNLGWLSENTSEGQPSVSFPID